MTYTFKDKNGAVKLYKNGQIIVVILSGACGTNVINFYSEKLRTLAQTCDGRPWAYLCNGKDFEATTPEAQQTIVGVYDYCLRSGCHFEAYCFDSPVGKAQTQKIMLDCGNPTDIEDVLFKNESEAEIFLLNKLEKLSIQTLKTNKISNKLLR